MHIGFKLSGLDHAANSTANGFLEMRARCCLPEVDAKCRGREDITRKSTKPRLQHFGGFQPSLLLAMGMHLCTRVAIPQAILVNANSPLNLSKTIPGDPNLA